jgi:hypothetical protein
MIIFEDCHRNENKSSGKEFHSKWNQEEPIRDDTQDDK